MARKDLLSRLADAGEEAIAKLADTPGGDRMMGAVNSMRERVDELQRRVRGIDELERRVTELERRLGVESPPQAGAAGGIDMEDEAPSAGDVPLLDDDAGVRERVGDVGGPSTVSPMPPVTPPPATPPPVPPAPVEGGASDPFAESAESAEVAGDVPYVSGDRAETEPSAESEPGGERPPGF